MEKEDQIPHDEFWDDKVKRLKKAEASQEVIKESSKIIPYPAAFYEIAVALRKDIRARRKEGIGYNDLLRKLYRYAVIENFFQYIQWKEIISARILHSIARSCLKDIKCPYKQLGYEQLDLLNQTDVKWLVENWGEPTQHSNAKDIKLELWEQAVVAFESAKKRDEEYFWRSAGFQVPQKEVKESTTITDKASGSGGCLGLVVLGLVFIVFVVVVIGSITNSI